MRLFLYTLLMLFTTASYARSGRYIELDGRDSNLCIGMDTLNNSWSIEMWIRANDNQWKEQEILIGGDFNSCSHLDWTERSKHLHYGYGKVDFPTSQFMKSKGFNDSYRMANPDEVTHQGSTDAVVFGQLQNSRIDYLYHRGNITALYAKIIRTSEEIDFVWDSDHAAVFVIYSLN